MVIPKYETVIRELTYAIRDLASATDIAAARAGESDGPLPSGLNYTYTVHDEHGALQIVVGRLKGALHAALEHEQRLAKDALLVESAAKARDADATGWPGGPSLTTGAVAPPSKGKRSRRRG